MSNISREISEADDIGESAQVEPNSPQTGHFGNWYSQEKTSRKTQHSEISTSQRAKHKKKHKTGSAASYRAKNQLYKTLKWKQQAHTVLKLVANTIQERNFF